MDPETTDEPIPAAEPKAPVMPKALDVLTKAAYERIGDSLKGRALNGFTAVKASDVLVVGASLTPEGRTEVVKVLMKGAAGNNPDAEIFQRTDHLAHLIEQVRAG